METASIAEGELYRTVGNPQRIVKVTKVWDDEISQGVAYDILDLDRSGRPTLAYSAVAPGLFTAMYTPLYP